MVQEFISLFSTPARAYAFLWMVALALAFVSVYVLHHLNSKDKSLKDVEEGYDFDDLDDDYSNDGDTNLSFLERLFGVKVGKAARLKTTRKKRVLNFEGNSVELDAVEAEYIKGILKEKASQRKEEENRKKLIKERELKKRREQQEQQEKQKAASVEQREKEEAKEEKAKEEKTQAAEVELDLIREEGRKIMFELEARIAEYESKYQSSEQVRDILSYRDNYRDGDDIKGEGDLDNLLEKQNELDSAFSRSPHQNGLYDEGLRDSHQDKMGSEEDLDNTFSRSPHQNGLYDEGLRDNHQDKMESGLDILYEDTSNKRTSSLNNRDDRIKTFDRAIRPSDYTTEGFEEKSDLDKLLGRQGWQDSSFDWHKSKDKPSIIKPQYKEVSFTERQVQGFLDGLMMDVIPLVDRGLSDAQVTRTLVAKNPYQIPSHELVPMLEAVRDCLGTVDSKNTSAKNRFTENKYDVDNARVSLLRGNPREAVKIMEDRMKLLERTANSLENEEKTKMLGRAADISRNIAVLVKVSSVKDSFRHVNHSLALDNDNVKTLNVLGYMSIRVSDLYGAEKAFLKAIEQSVEGDNLWSYLAREGVRTVEELLGESDSRNSSRNSFAKTKEKEEKEKEEKEKEMEEKSNSASRSSQVHANAYRLKIRVVENQNTR